MHSLYWETHWRELLELGWRNPEGMSRKKDVPFWPFIEGCRGLHGIEEMVRCKSTVSIV
jgi:hypothetical protein